MHDNRIITVGPLGTTYPTINKRPADAFIIEVRFGTWLNGRGTLSSMTATISPAGPTVGSTTTDGTDGEFLLSAGSDAYTGTLTITGTCSNGEIKAIEVPVTVNAA